MKFKLTAGGRYASTLDTMWAFQKVKLLASKSTWFVIHSKALRLYNQCVQKSSWSKEQVERWTQGSKQKQIPRIAETLGSIIVLVSVSQISNKMITSIDLFSPIVYEKLNYMSTF